MLHILLKFHHISFLGNFVIIYPIYRFGYFIFAKSPIKPLLMKNDSEIKSLMLAPKVFVGLSKSSIFNTLLNCPSFLERQLNCWANQIMLADHES